MKEASEKSLPSEGKHRNIGIKLSIIAKSKGLTQNEIALRCGVSRISIHRFFNGRTELKASDLFNVLDVLGISIDHEIENSLSGALEGKSLSQDPIYRDVCRILQSSTRQIRKTLFEQISWWVRSLACPDSQESTHRIQQYVREM